MMVLISKMIEYFIILAFVKPDHLPDMERHQYYIIRYYISTCFKLLHFFHGLKVLMLQKYILDVWKNVTKKSHHFQISLQHPPNIILICKH